MISTLSKLTNQASRTWRDAASDWQDLGNLHATQAFVKKYPDMESLKQAARNSGQTR